MTSVMTETDNNISDKKLRLTIRFGRNSMAFAVGDPQENGMLVYELRNEYGYLHSCQPA